ncbi:9658_t:CDS:2 [Funneliformis geosporum]|uniref:Derlin n=1 Tax=Funneliformis geosporum TaxID=1117311 RepID=A0A9W4SEY0_9GLOM|nr:9658_t:CDS:2 [Funneliformis geosporum]CAI2164628.1 15820_t:CDS:2 [Funneliformis geosporum]
MNGQPPLQRQPQNELVAWYKEIPICTRFLFTSFILITVLGNIGKITPYLFFFPELAFGHFQIIGGIIKGLVLFNQSLVMAITYIWAQLFKDVMVTFMFGLRFKGVYLPYVLLAFEALQMGGALPWASIIGIITGHLYYYLKELYPASGGTRFLNTPQWLYNWFPVNTSSGGLRTSFGAILNPGERVQQQSSTDRTRHSWGRGQRLGS